MKIKDFNFVYIIVVIIVIRVVDLLITHFNKEKSTIFLLISLLIKSLLIVDIVDKINYSGFGFPIQK